MLVTGNVRDYNSEPIVNAHVIVKNSFPLKGTVTDFDGNFKIVTDPDAVLIFSHVGTAETVEKNINYSTNIQVTMNNEIQLPEIIVTGQKPKNAFNWWWLLLIPAGYIVYEKTKTKPKKIII